MKHIYPYLTEVEMPLRKTKSARLICDKESRFILIATPDVLFAKWNLHHQVNWKN